MTTRQLLGVGLAVAMTIAAVPVSLAAAGQQTATISGTAKNEAQPPYSQYSVRAHNSQNGQLSTPVPLGPDGQFRLAQLPLGTYTLELLNHDGTVVCTAGPFAMTAQNLTANNATIDCTATLGGTAQDEAHKPFQDYSVRARDTKGGQITSWVSLDPNGHFHMPTLDPSSYLVELVNPKGDVICTEGPFDMTSKPLVKDDININCRKMAGWWLLTAAAGAGVTGVVLAAGEASPSQ